MVLKPSDLRMLVQATLATREQEIGCDTCLERVAAYAEVHLAGLPTPEALRLVEEHLAICGECQEEFAALAAALDAGAAR
ncbi:hypothetical protein WME89_01535 [Sorangium sp. So ce321]|uniref:hypothetical protein n=1 Tax=Sorangium sp. So ce321 TaxID=3133300 RepID=UPI003F5D6C0E